MLIIILNAQSYGINFTYYIVTITVHAFFPKGSFYSWIINPITPFQNISNDYLSQIVYVNKLEFNINGTIFNNYTSTYDQDNNVIINVKLPEIKHNTYMIFNISYIIYRENKKSLDISLDKSGSLSDIPNQFLNDTYLGFNDAWINDTRIRDVAIKMLNRSNVLDTVLKYSEWIDANILYPVSPSHLEPWNATRVFEYKEGDCDDRAILLIAMLRSVGIPAYLQIGAIYMNNTKSSESWNNLSYKLINVGWHGWAMVYIPPWGWLPVDLTYFKDALTSESRINNSTYMRLTTSNPLNHIIGSALFTNTVFIISSIIKSDYVIPSVRWFDTILKYNITWNEIDKIDSVTTMESYSFNNGVLFITLPVIVVFTYIFMRRNLRKQV
jgi:transglutaminase-like putative cysteine protease